jgi:transposase
VITPPDGSLSAFILVVELGLLIDAGPSDPRGAFILVAVSRAARWASGAAYLEGADALLPGIRADAVIADKAFDAEERVLGPLARAGKAAVIPPKANRKNPRPYDRDLYKARHLIENFFAKLKQYRAESGVKRNIPGRCGNALAEDGNPGWGDVGRDTSDPRGEGAAGRAEG